VVSSAASSFAQPMLPLVSSAVSYRRIEGSDHFSFTFPTPNVSLANYYGLASVQFNAPPGYAFYCAPGPLGIYVCYGTPTTYTGGVSGIPTFDCLFGGPSTPTASAFGWSNETGFAFGNAVEFDSPCEFTSATLLCHSWQAGTLDAYQHQLPLSPFSEAYLSSGALSLVPIPEPGFALVALAGLLVLARTRAYRERQ
jgi:hypothetical protein